MPSYRLERVANIISVEISQLIYEGKIKDYRVTPLINITHVEVSKDLAHAKVWISTLGKKETLDNALLGMESAKGFIQSQLGKKLQTRYTPKLVFIADDGVSKALEIQNKIDMVIASDQTNS